MTTLEHHALIHPTVLLGITDHYTRIKSKNVRAVGILLGSSDRKGQKIIHDCSNYYAVPFDENASNPDVWYFNANFHEEMYDLVRKVSQTVSVVGWYSTGSSFQQNDLAIHQLIRKYCEEPIYLLVDVENPDSMELPTQTFISVEDIPEFGTTGAFDEDVPAEESTASSEPSSSESNEPIHANAHPMKFVKVETTISALEAESIGVEHILRDIKDTSSSLLSKEISTKMNSLKSLIIHLNGYISQLDQMINKEIPYDSTLVNKFQSIFNALPNLSMEDFVTELTRSANDNLLCVYTSVLLKAVTALHTVIDNKLEIKEAQIAREKAKLDETNAPSDAPKTKTDSSTK